MRTFLNILFKTSTTFDDLDDQFEDNLEANANLLFMLVGMVSGIDLFFKDHQYFKEYPIIIVALGFILVSAGFSLVIGRYLTTYILYAIGKLIKGKSKIIDMRVVAAYSAIPILLKLPVILYFGFTGNILVTGSISYWILSSFYLVLWVWTLKIMLQGVMKFQEFGFVKGIINISPFLLLGIMTFLLI
ncbi:YIP1 family protein [Marinifilum caeruleilacunae]|uniref:Yip1 domain-containing protein n=1 Tax=Marinifilum caeruleilacunae TaxID=2499076 RepID=A0ABX1WUM9_9BACT|nr:YIP1 family protein [Marinifilum caeruleilacunae]NOU59645.1 hypothetical protein [Marinifilum caeruleilacunae]